MFSIKFYFHLSTWQYSYRVYRFYYAKFTGRGQFVQKSLVGDTGWLKLCLSLGSIVVFTNDINIHLDAGRARSKIND